jgi:hypothetical protein
MADLFESSRRKIARAKAHLADFDRQMHVFLRENPYRYVTYPDPQHPEHVIHKLRFEKGIPDSLIDLTDESIHHLRSCLDVAVYSLVAATGKVRPKSTAFPFAGSVGDFENNMKGRCKDVPEEIYPLFRAFKPYKGGDDVLWALNEVCVREKHTLLGMALGSHLGGVTLTGGVVRMHLAPPWDRLKNEIGIGTFVRGTDLHYKAEIGLPL